MVVLPELKQVGVVVSKMPKLGSKPLADSKVAELT
jgi:hypothetical protein